MLGRLVRELPVGDYLYEPKWDGFRAIVVRERTSVELHSRSGRPLARYFPELVEALEALDAGRFVVDGEILLAQHDFAALMARLHPAASRVAELSAATPAILIAFDLISVGGRDLRSEPFAERRARLAQLVPGASEQIRLTPITDDIETAQTWLERPRQGVDGVMAKDRRLPYRPGERAMLKVKLERTLECVVAGFRLLADRPEPSSLLLGLYDGEALEHVGIAGSFSARLRRQLLEDLGPLIVPLAGHPWEHGFLLEGSPLGRLKGAAGRWAPGEMSLDWIPVDPIRVAEVSYDHIEDRRLRHPARFRRWRPDRDPRSCTFEQP